MTRVRFEAKAARALSLLLFVSFAAQTAAFNDVRLDDAFITYRYSQNLATGHGLVFNPGEHLLGTTSPGHALVGAVLYAVVGKSVFPALMAIVGCVGWSAQVVCSWFLLRSPLGRWGAAFVAAAIAVGATRAYLWVSLETNLVAALVVGGFAAAAHRRWLLCGSLMGVAVVFRADALLAAGVLSVLAWPDRRAPTFRVAAATFTIPVVTWGTFSFASFGTVLPHTFHAKLGHSTIPGYALHALRYPALSLAPWSRVADSGIDGSATTVVAMWTLAVAGAVVLGRRSRTAAAFVVFGLLHGLAYVAMHPDTAFGWHLYPLVLVFAVCALSALSAAASHVPRPAAWLAAPCVFAALGVEAVLFAQREPFLPAFGMRDNLDHMVAAYLSAVAAPGDYVSAEEVGTVAYFSELPMVDYSGLVSDGAIVELFAAARGRPSRVRWAILNPWEANVGKADFAHYASRSFTEGGLTVTVCDLHERVR